MLYMAVTIKKVAQLAAVNGKPKILWDDKIFGFGVRALPSGRKTFILKYRMDGGGRSARQRFMKVGTVGIISVDQARKIARENLYQVSQGNDPQALRFSERSAPNMGELWALFEDKEIAKVKSSTARDYRAYWTNDISPDLASLKVAGISRSDIEAIHTRMRNTPYKANRVRSLLSRLLNQAEKWEYRGLGTNPCKFVKPYKEKPKSRFLSDVEIKKLFSVLKDCEQTGVVNASICNGIRLLLLTGARKMEVFGCRVDWLSFEDRQICLPDSKTGKRKVYLSRTALEICQVQKSIADAKNSAYLFPSPIVGKPLTNIKKGWNIIRDRADLKDVRLHDLRHTHASLAIKSGKSLAVIGEVLGHTQARTTQRYAHVANDPAFSAVEDVSDIVDGLID